MGLRVGQTVEMIGSLTENSVVQWFTHLHEVCSEFLCDNPVILDQNHIVEIDETFLSHRKYNRGVRRKETVTVFRMIECNTSKVVQIVPNKSHVVLLPIIQRYVVDGAAVISNCAKMYDTLSQEGYDHSTVNHKYNFVNPIDLTQTNTIEGFWGHFKKRF